MKKYKLKGEQLRWHAFRAYCWKKFVSKKSEFLKRKSEKFKNGYLAGHEKQVKDMIYHFKKIGYDGEGFFAKDMIQDFEPMKIEYQKLLRDNFWEILS